uniref:Tyrosine-protein kinase catalytic domain-containing protein n=1 Tax=Oreochromis niloticus TaxID=8128 RepID=I3JWZ4_ORENI
METVKPFFSAATNIYKLAKKVKANKKRCQRISVRVKAFEGVVKSITEFSPQVEKALGELILTLDSAQKLIEKYTAANLVERILKSGSHGDEFDTVSERLNDAYQVLCVALQSEQRKMLYEEDDTEMTKCEEKLNLSLETFKQSSLVALCVLLYSLPSNIFSTSRDVKSIFNKEVDTMKQFELPNILRMFGICIQDENGPHPQFFIIMEYCEKGSLRQVLDSDYTLTWIRKAHMCLDAAQGLYRSVCLLYYRFQPKLQTKKYREQLPDDCPAELGQLINECRAYDGFQRPSAGVLLDKLRSVVTQMEEQQD